MGPWIEHNMTRISLINLKNKQSISQHVYCVQMRSARCLRSVTRCLPPSWAGAGMQTMTRRGGLSLLMGEYYSENIGWILRKKCYNNINCELTKFLDFFPFLSNLTIKWQKIFLIFLLIEYFSGNSQWKSHPRKCKTQKSNLRFPGKILYW